MLNPSGGERKMWYLVVHGDDPWPTVVSKHATAKNARLEIERIRYNPRFLGVRLRIVLRPLTPAPRKEEL